MAPSQVPACLLTETLTAASVPFATRYAPASIVAPLIHPGCCQPDTRYLGKNPNQGKDCHANGDDPNCDGRNLFPRQVFFTMAVTKDGWAQLARNLRAEIETDLIEA